MASATPDMCTRSLRLPYSLPNIFLHDLANVRKEFVMRKSRPSITNVSFCGPAFRPLSAVRTSVRGLRRRRQILHGYWTPAKSRNSSPISSLLLFASGRGRISPPPPLHPAGTIRISFLASANGLLLLVGPTSQALVA